VRQKICKTEKNTAKAATAEVHNRLAGLKICETCRVTTPPRQVAGSLWHLGKFRLSVEPLIHCKARTGLLLARSTGLLAATFLGKFAISIPDYFLDFINLHVYHLPLVLKLSS
jgi:hypothetical protein